MHANAIKTDRIRELARAVAESVVNSDLLTDAHECEEAVSDLLAQATELLSLLDTP